MKKYTLTIFISLFFVSHGQFTPLNPFEDIDAFTSVTQSGEVMLLGTNTNKIIRSTDGGTSWSKLTINIPTGLNKLNSAYGIHLGAGNGGKVIRSTDGGLTWSFLATSTTNDLFDIISISPALIFACGANGTVIRSTDGGGTWTVSNPVPFRLNSIRFSTFLTGWAAGDNGVVIKTTDGGISWTRVTGAGAACNYAVVSLFAQDGIFLFGREGQKMVSTDGGTNWSYTSETVYMVGDTVIAAWNYSRDTAVYADDRGALTIVVMTPQGFRSGRFTNDPPILSKYHAVFRTEDKKFLAVGQGPSISRLELNNSWTSLITLLRGRNLRFLKFAGNGTGLVAGFQDGSNPDLSDVFVTPDGGVSWKLSKSTVYLKNLHTIPEGNIYIAELNSWVSSDTGRTWRKQTDVSGSKRDLVFVDPSTGYCIDYYSMPVPGTPKGRFYITRNGGSSWNLLKTFESYSVWKIFADKSGRVWITSGGSAVVNVSADSGRTLTEIYLPGFYSGDIAIGANIGTNGYIVYEQCRVFHTSSGGSSFTKTYDAANMTARAVSNAIAGQSLVVGNAGKIIATTDHGATWQQLPEWTSLDLTSVWLMPDLSFIVTTSTGEVLKGDRPGIFTGIEDENTEMPAEFTLGNYPNPFNGSTVIHFTLPNDSDCRLEVFSPVGSRVFAVDIKGVKGTNSYSFDASSFNSGVYLYRLTAGGKAFMGKMVYLK
ncbi:MAG: hypothetical protein HBSAPP04_05700 [Ignavibacteriaceae bacterium]|nr:MAG: T9SS C-terminal target domain-containing protein [Chlorobiota bacterium]GJQ31731.1 MAG: hypothetical protein HBSAPP04_05700 [Ignavibacteriaceae bacterium]